MGTSESEAAEEPLSTALGVGVSLVGRQTAHSAGRAGPRCPPESRMPGRINLAGVSAENIDLKCSAVFETQVRSVGWSSGTISLE